MLNFSVFKVNLDGSLSNRENLSHEELDGYIASVYGKFATIKVVASSGKEVIYTDNGLSYEKV